MPAIGPDPDLDRIDELHERLRDTLETTFPSANAFDLLIAMTYEVGQLAGQLAAEGMDVDALSEQIAQTMRSQMRLTLRARERR